MYTKIVCTYVNKFEIISSLFYSLASFKFFFFFFYSSLAESLNFEPLIIEVIRSHFTNLNLLLRFTSLQMSSRVSNEVQVSTDC